MPHNCRVRRSLPLVLALWLLAGLVAAFVILPAAAVKDPPRASAPTGSVAPLRVAVVGDSLSAGRSRFLGNGLDDETWMTYADGDGIDFVGGWARSGATPDEMAAAVKPIDDVDVLVILAGTNAVRTGKTMAQETGAYERIVSVISPKRVLVSSIPPYRAHAAAALLYGEDLRRVVGAHGWQWIDPWAIARDGDDWSEGFSVDGTHPAGPAQYEVLGQSFRRLILETRMFPSALG